MFNVFVSIMMVLALVVGPVHAETKEVTDAETLSVALENGEDVTLGNDISKEADITAPYGNKTGYIQNGGVLDGAGHTLEIICNGDHYGIMTSGGTIKNLTIEEGCRAIMIMSPNQDIILDNVALGGDGVLYPLNTGEHAVVDGVDLIVTDSTFKGWTSFAGIESASFTNCTFGVGSYYNEWPYGTVVKPYVPTTFTNCEFDGDYYLDLTKLKEGSTVVFDNCTVDGELVTADNIEELFAEIEFSTTSEGSVVVPYIEATIGTTSYATLKDAIAAAKAGDVVVLHNDVTYTDTSTLTIEKEITLDLNGNTLTTNGTYGGIIAKNNCSIINGTIVHNGTVAAIKAYNVKSFEDLTIQVTGKEGKEIGGISVQANSSYYVETIKNVTITGGTYGIETQYVGDSKNPVIGTMENVTIDAVENGLKLMAPVGTVKDSTISSDNIGINMFRKGLGSVTITLENCEVTGNTAVYIHDEEYLDSDYYNNTGDLELIIDDNTKISGTNGVAVECGNSEDANIVYNAAIGGGILVDNTEDENEAGIYFELVHLPTNTEHTYRVELYAGETN